MNSNTFTKNEFINVSLGLTNYSTIQVQHGIEGKAEESDAELDVSFHACPKHVVGEEAVSGNRDESCSFVLQPNKHGIEERAFRDRIADCQDIKNSIQSL